MNLTWIDTLSEENANFVKSQVSDLEIELADIQKGPQVQSKDISSFYPGDYEEHFKAFIKQLNHPLNQAAHQQKLPATGTLVEIGPYLGKSTVAWAETLPGYKIHCIDLFMGINKGKFAGIIKEDEHLKTFVKNIAGREQITYEKAFFYPHYIPPEEFAKPTILYFDGMPEHLEMAKEYWTGKVDYFLSFDYENETIEWGNLIERR